jgi:transposase-like protein
MKRWYGNLDAISPIFKFSSEVRKVIYTTNAELHLPETEPAAQCFSHRYRPYESAVSVHI